MVFSDQAFLFAFLPIALLTCIALANTVAFNAAILFFSLVFFYWGSGNLILLLIFSIAVNFSGGLLLKRHRSKWVLAGLLIVNLGLLAYFKYLAFGLHVFHYFGNPTLENFAKTLLLPIGISFYTFQGISYLLDVWRGHVAPERNLITYAAYKSFFPQLIAGPIVRYADVHEDFHKPRVAPDLFAAGAARFMLGLSKKVLIADVVAPIADALFAGGGHPTFATAWLGAIAFTVQLYFDFSGYSDMAIGLAKMMGIRFKENFNHPFAASSITEFWRRWHMSLTSWFRDYLYVPLGGNRHGAVKTYRNLLIVFLATGAWHGAAWTFIVWGLYQGALLIVERAAGLRDKASAALRFGYLLPATVIGFALFASPNLKTFKKIGLAMFAPLGSGAFDLNNKMIVALGPQAILALLVGCAAIVLQRRIGPMGPILEQVATPLQQWVRLAAVAGAAVATGAYVLPQSFSPFLYFRF